MHRPIAFVLSLILAGCGAASSGPPQQDVPPPPAWSPFAMAPPAFDLRTAELPARPAGAAFAVAGQEHALVRTSLPIVMPATPSSTAAQPSLAAHVLKVQAAYQRWCAGMTLPSDTALLDRAGGLYLPGAIACTPHPVPASSGGEPRQLIRATGPAARRRLTSEAYLRLGRKRVQPSIDTSSGNFVQTLQEGVFGRFLLHCRYCWNPAWRPRKDRFRVRFIHAKPSIVLPWAYRHKHSKQSKTPDSCSTENRAFKKIFGRGFTGFGALGSLLSVWLLLGTPALALELPVGSRFLGRGSDGWFWYESLPAPALPPEPAPPPPAMPPGGGSSAAIEPIEPAGPAPLTAAWFRLELERFRDQAIDAPTPENVRAYLYLQKVMLDKADAFARTSQQVAAADPYLDAITERPLSPFAANATSAEATARRGEVLRELAESTGLLFIVESSCSVCVRAAGVLLSAQRQYGFALLTVALDGKAPSGLELPVRPDTGQARQLGVVGTPALFLMRPPDTILPLAQGALDLDTLTARIVDQAHAVGWIDDAVYAATRAVRQPWPVPEPDSLASIDLRTPERLVGSLRQQLGLPAGDLP